jgi:drug/metabolite transporter (DMT)-like permease
MKAGILTGIALVCFALNSILCRLALGTGEADAVSFTVVRILSGAAVLWLLVLLRKGGAAKKAGGNWTSALFLFGYAILFSFAYLELTAATGALLLFGAVQFTMIVAAAFGGDRPRPLEILGIAAAFGGLVYLLLPGLEAPGAAASAMMIGAGAAWGFYTLRGRNGGDPLSETAGNFARASGPAVLAALPFLSSVKLSSTGILLAVLSGAAASGAGYAVWYSALKHLTAARAASFQLSVPLLAALGGALLLGESLTFRVAAAGALILGGIGIVIAARSSKASPNSAAKQ